MMLLTVISKPFSAKLRAVLMAVLTACCTHPFPATAGDQQPTQLTHVPVLKSRSRQSDGLSFVRDNRTSVPAPR